ncbi:MAG: glycosyltransferase [Rhodobacteraceae bacterium]|nr:glycosyltransferase [Paracoccaceae bacterium]
MTNIAAFPRARSVVPRRVMPTLRLVEPAPPDPAPPPAERIALDDGLLAAMGREAWLHRGVVPVTRLPGAVVLAAVSRADVERAADALPPGLGTPVHMPATRAAIDRAVIEARGEDLARRAETLAPAAVSARTAPSPRSRLVRAAAAALAAGAAIAFPQAAFLVLLVLALAGMAAATGLRLAAFAAALRAGAPQPAPAARRAPPGPLPMISLLVPLYREGPIAPDLVRALAALDYPAGRLDLILIVEAGDDATRAALERAELPAGARLLTVPPGPIRTKPRALNFALPFARGEIVGVLDAEDRPAPDQLRVIAARFAAAPADVACLQGVLDFYDARRSVMARLFAIEYAAWFRAVLPGLARLGLVVPLGGTTVYFRRQALLDVGGWDAHNVTEDAELGLRLARAGLRTEIVGTVTAEEPNDRPLAWIRQRSRWLKGYGLTWAAHMRAPRRLAADLGAVRFAAVQVLFLGTVLQFLLAPVLWTLWLGGAGPALPPWAFRTAVTLCLLAEATNAVVALWALRRAGHGWLMPWVPAMLAYYPLATLAAFKALALSLIHI